MKLLTLLTILLVKIKINYDVDFDLMLDIYDVFLCDYTRTIEMNFHKY